MPLEEGKFLVRYLRVPIISTRLLKLHCKMLVEKVRNRIGNWKNKSLSSAGRLQLISSVLFSLQGYWASMFTLPVSVIDKLERIMRGFLWCQGDLKAGKAKVAWVDICLPKTEGGLGIRWLSEWNISLLSAHIWSIVTRKETLWVRWVHAYKLCGSSFWNVSSQGNLSWGWRSLLNIRNIIRPFLWYKVGNGHSISA